MNDRIKQLHAGMTETGQVEDIEAETYVGIPNVVLAPAQYAVRVDIENRFVGFTVDNGPTDIEVRLPFEMVDSLKAMVAAVVPSPPVS